MKFKFLTNHFNDKATVPKKPEPKEFAIQVWRSPDWVSYAYDMSQSLSEGKYAAWQKAMLKTPGYSLRYGGMGTKQFVSIPPGDDLQSKPMEMREFFRELNRVSPNPALTAIMESWATQDARLEGLMASWGFPRSEESAKTVRSAAVTPPTYPHPKT
jgi:hypothetical protein